MTEADAKTKWCPMVRIGDRNEPVSMNRGDEANNHCIGSDCMMWLKTEPLPMVVTRDGQIVHEFYEQCGRCGLAGKP